MRTWKALIFTILTVVSLVLSPGPAAFAGVPVAPSELQAAATARLNQIPEFQFIRQQAEALGVRVWLFGGTAASYLHYVKWDLQRQHGDPRFRDAKFDFGITEIYRSSQDLDIVIDGNSQQRVLLENALKQMYPHLLGEKTIWEVRLLNQSMSQPGAFGYKEGLLSFDFQNQNTDSDSTGMIELTRKGAEAVIRDLKDWQNQNTTRFLQDASIDHISFYRSPKHFETVRAKLGENPEVISVIRALGKAFQYHLSFSDQDVAVMKKIISEFNPEDIQGDITKKRLIALGKKLFKHAVDIEYAWNVLEATGLRKKLMQFDDAKVVGTLAWWMNKEPLRSFEVGTGSGETAQALNLDKLTHQTNSDESFESITRAYDGSANVVISRQGQAGEMAMYGDGFYTAKGELTDVHRGAGPVVVFRLKPEARENTDFAYLRGNEYILILNKAAISLVGGTLEITPLEFFKALAKDPFFYEKNAGRIEKTVRKIERDVNLMSDGQLQEIKNIVLQTPPTKEIRGKSIHQIWFDLKASQRFPEAFEEFANRYGLYNQDTNQIRWNSFWSHRAAAWRIANLASKQDLSITEIHEIIHSPGGNTFEVLSAMMKNPEGAEFLVYEVLYAVVPPISLDSNVFDQLVKMAIENKIPGSERLFKGVTGAIQPSSVRLLLARNDQELNGSVLFHVARSYYHNTEKYPELLIEALRQCDKKNRGGRIAEFISTKGWAENAELKEFVKGLGLFSRGKVTLGNLLKAIELGRRLPNEKSPDVRACDSLLQ